MDETNPTDTTANRAAGSNTALVASSDGAQPQPNDGAIPLHPVQSVQISIPTVPPAQSVSVQPPIQIPVPPPVQPIPLQSVQLPLQTQIAAVEGVDTVPVKGAQPTPQTASEPAPKPLRDDIARIIGKIKLPERITLKMRGGQVKPPAPPAPIPSPADSSAKENVVGIEAPFQSPEAPAQTPQETAGAQKGNEPASFVASVHTLKDDLQNVVRDKKMSLVRAVALESEKKKGQEHLAGLHLPVDEARSRKVIGIAFVATIFLALVGVAFFGVKSVLLQESGEAQPVAAPSLMFAEGTFTFPEETRTGIDLRRALITEVNKIPSISLGAIVRIIPATSETGPDGSVKEVDNSIGDFLTAIEAQAAPELIRSFRGDFFFGLHKTTEKLAPVLIIPVASYERAFAGMLAWEPTMSGDLSPIFSFIPPQTMDEKGLFVERKFEDALINNYDVRVLKNDSGAAQLMYSFPTRTMLIISESQYSFTEALSRLRASRRI